MSKLIPLTNNKFSLVDDDVFEHLSQWKWSVLVAGSNRNYAVRMLHSPRRNVLMHREILNYFGKKDIDHIDGDGLNNQRNNLRVCSRSTNLRNCKIRKNNTTGYTNIEKDGKIWRVRVRVNKTRLSIGSFKTLFEAVSARDKFKIKNFDV